MFPFLHEGQALTDLHEAIGHLKGSHDALMDRVAILGNIIVTCMLGVVAAVAAAVFSLVKKKDGGE